MQKSIWGKTKMDFQKQIKENLQEIKTLKKSNLYCLKNIRNKNTLAWEKKEYINVIKMNNKRIRELANHNKKLGGFN